MEFFKGKRTLIINVLMVLAAALGAVGDTGWVEPQTMVYVISVVNILLRFITTGPISLGSGGTPS